MQTSAGKSVKPREIVLAILPFQTMGGGDDHRFLSMGFTEDLITGLSKFSGLSVISHHSTQHIKSLSDRELINQLRADYLVIGSFRAMKDHIRISIQLILGKDDTILFASQYNVKEESLINTEDTVIQQIVNVLQQQIDYNLLSYSYKQKETALPAYVNWLKGMDVLKKGNSQSDLKARDYFNRALEIDGNFSRAYTGISLSYFNEWSCRLWERWDVSKQGAQDFALKALEFDENDYLALMVLGRTYLYTGEFEKAEHCLRKSIRMNPNDANNLIQVAFWMVYLGYAAESEKLYQRANVLNPFHKDAYFAYGSLIYFELGRFEKCLEISLKVPVRSVWVDFPAYLAATWFHLGRMDKVAENWKIYLEIFENKIFDGSGDLEKTALKWHQTVNPYKVETNLEPFWEYISGDSPVEYAVHADDKHTKGVFVRRGDMWELSFKNTKAIIKDAKGLHDLVKMLAEPGKEFHCSVLMESALENESGIEASDARAKTDYQQKIRALQYEIGEAEAMNDQAKLTELQETYDRLLEHLSASMGLAGKSRTIGSAVEKARAAVTWRIRNAIKKIEKAHPSLGKHLSVSVKTGTFCSYNPETAIHWQL